MSEYEYRHSEPSCSHAVVEPALRKLLALQPNGTNICDLGCGNGALLGSMIDRGWNLTGIDSSISGIGFAAATWPQVRWHVGDVTGELPAAVFGNEFDVVISTEVIEHLYFPRRLAANAFRILRPGGRFILSTPYHGYLKNIALAATCTLDRHFTALWDHGHIKFFSRRTLYTLLHDAGFVDLRFAGVGRVPFLWKSMVVGARKPASCIATQGGRSTS
jgi:2-polyprenyl-3-methyl-5-hydroxy-6-metoxy-1,4-benzoquinol methylase